LNKIAATATFISTFAAEFEKLENSILAKVGVCWAFELFMLLLQPPLNKIAAVATFIPTFTAEFEKLESSILAKKLGKTAQDKIGWIRTCLNQAGKIGGREEERGEEGKSGREWVEGRRM
jgi:hypothetical protein